MHADSLTSLAISLAQSLPQVILVEDLCEPTEMEKEKAQIHQIRVGPSWMDPIVVFLKDDILPEEKREANKVRRKARCPKIKSCTSTLFLDHICYAFILK